MNLESISIKNLRCLMSEQELTIPPLTLVVGANSTGKSTFVRTFPLLRQSVETVTKGPILWFGRLADFGVFKDAVSKNVDNQEIEFGFTVKLDKDLHVMPDHFFAHFGHYPQFLTVASDSIVKVLLVVAEDSETSSTYAKRVGLSANGRFVEIGARPDGRVESFQLDGDILDIGKVDISLKSGTSLFSVNVTQKIPATKKNIFEASWIMADVRSAFQDQLMNHVEEIFHGSTNEETKMKFIRTLGIGTCSALLAQVKVAAGVTPTSSARVKKLRSDSPWIKELQGLVLADRAPQLLVKIDGFISSIFRSVSYIKPLRATAERFYRQQDLAVDEVDPQGANLAMFLMGLSADERAEFSNWCKENIGFSVEAKPVGAHVSIYLEDSNGGGVFNVADMGFGYSQLLPVLATIWLAVTKGPSSSDVTQGSRLAMMETSGADVIPKIIAIEQPELHLHPNLQGKLADLLCALVRNGGSPNRDIRFVCETHSETIVNQIGNLIAQGRIKPEQVQVLLFEKQEGTRGSNVRKAKYDSDGVLTNWPYGFFLPSED